MKASQGVGCPPIGVNRILNCNQPVFTKNNTYKQNAQCLICSVLLKNPKKSEGRTLKKCL